MTPDAKSDLNIAIGKIIKKLRLEHNWRQEVVARKLAISIPAYSKIESGATDVNMSRLEEIARVFKINIVDLLANETGKETESLSIPLKLLAERENEIAILQQKIEGLEDELYGK